MTGLNKVMLIGNLGKDPDVRTLDNGVALVTFPLATSESYKDKNGEKVARTEWHNIVVWRGLAEIASKILHKGSRTYIEGKLSSRSYTDKEGHKKYNTEIIADQILALDNKDSKLSRENPDVSEDFSNLSDQSTTFAPDDDSDSIKPEF